MSPQVLSQWLPNLIVVVLVAFPAFFLIRRSLVRRLTSGVISAVAFLHFFGEALDPPFSFTRVECFPPLLLGLALAWLLASGGRALRKQLSSGRIW
jgi:hypothetical protein